MSESPVVAGFLDALFPPRCPVCGAADDCGRHRLPARGEGPRCSRCSNRLAPSLPDGERCAACRREPPGFGRCLALGDYRPGAPLRDWILALKHGGRRDLAVPLGEALAERLLESGGNWLEDAVLVPIPLHPWRLFERGYDQAAALARAISPRAGLPRIRALKRRRWTEPQGSAGCRSRRANVRDVFRLRARARREVVGRTVWLVDDVLTSGATASEGARLLRRAGARRVGVLVVGRAGGGERWRTPDRSPGQESWPSFATHRNPGGGAS